MTPTPAPSKPQTPAVPGWRPRVRRGRGLTRPSPVPGWKVSAPACTVPRMVSQAAREHANLAEFVAAHGGRAYTHVPVSGPALGWPPDSPVHLADAVWF